jgi:hypothetical protein
MKQQNKKHVPASMHLRVGALERGGKQPNKQVKNNVVIKITSKKGKTAPLKNNKNKIEAWDKQNNFQ